MLDGAIVIPIQTLVWNLLFEIAALLWVVDRALLNVGYFLMTLTGWVTQNAFAPLLQAVGDQTGVLVGPIFVLALTVLGLTYILAVFGNFEVVNLRAAVMWLLFAAVLYTLGPGFYTGLEDFRRLVGGGFYELGMTAFQNGSQAAGLGAVGAAPGDNVTVPTDQLGRFLPGVPGASAVDGLDVALAYVGADGFDALAAPGSPHLIARLPWTMVVNGGDGFFDPDTGPNAFSSMADADRQAAIGTAIQGIWRLFTMLFIAIFGIIEQLIQFLMACSFAVAFISMAVAVLFGFFRRTEPIAWGALNLIIELFIQSLIQSLLLSLILGFVLIGANTSNAILLLGASLVGLWLSWNLLHGCIKGLTGSSERLYKSFSAATGGSFATVSETNKIVVETALAGATGASILAGGGSFLQALGGTLGDQRLAQTMNYAARMLGGDETLLGSAAQALGEGASARSLAGPLGGYLLGQQTSATHGDEQAQMRQNPDVRQVAARQDTALAQYRSTSNPATLAEAFAATDIPRVQALNASYNEPDYSEVAQTVRRVRQKNPDLPPQAPAFLSKVRGELPADLSQMDAPALQAFADLYGSPALPSAYETALAAFKPVASQLALGSADLTRDRAVSGQIPLTDAFSPDDAHRVAQLMDAYDDDDFALLVDAVRSARDQAPDQPPGSLPSLQTARQVLPQRLQSVPAHDLAAFSRAFGAAAGRPAPPNTSSPAAVYIGAADLQRDLVTQLVQDGVEDKTLLNQVFPPTEAAQVAQLAQDYDQPDFATVVHAVRQTRTLDPDLPSASPPALRATRRQLPPHLQQIPSRDLTAFSRAFGAAADPPSILREDDPHLLQRVRRRGRRLLPDMENLPDTADDARPTPPSQRAVDIIEIASASVPAADLYALPTVPRALASPADQALGLDQPPVPTPLVGLRRMQPAQRVGLTEAGIGSMEQLADATLPQISRAAQVTELRADEWRTSARTVVRSQAAREQQQAARLVQRTVDPATPTSTPVVTSAPTVPPPVGAVGPASNRATAAPSPPVNALPMPQPVGVPGPAISKRSVPESGITSQPAHPAPHVAPSATAPSSPDEQHS